MPNDLLPWEDEQEQQEEDTDWTCPNCNTVRNDDSEERTTEHDESACNECASPCEGCASVYLNDDMIYSDVRRNEGYYCESCHDNIFACCCSCSESILQSDAYNPNDETFCSDCYHETYFECESCCDEYHRDDCHYFNDEALCESCYDSAREDADYNDDDGDSDEDQEDQFTFKEYSQMDRPRILDYSRKPQLNFTQHVTDKPDALYLGIELELNFELCRFNEVYNITKKYLEGKFIFKHDGSIGEGAELVLSPITYRSLKNVNFKGMFEEYKKIGVTSYESGKCGLHVHISDNEITTHNNHALFYYKCFPQILKFSQRTDLQLQQWAKIEMPVKGRGFGSRYYACNRTKKTLEFRAFRGTIKYSRFKATLIFISALHEYLNGKKFDKLEKEKDLWLKFKSFLQYRNQYHFLVKYLESKNI